MMLVQTVGFGKAAAAGVVKYRVNHGGVQITSGDGDLNWEQDDIGAHASYWDNVDALNQFDVTDTIDLNDASIPAECPESMMQSEIYSDNTVTMTFTVTDGNQYKVRLFFAELFHTSSGSRVFDVQIDSVVKLDAYDIYADVGHDVGVMKEFTVTASGTSLEIKFDASQGDFADNWKINGLEIQDVT